MTGYRRFTPSIFSLAVALVFAACSAGSQTLPSAPAGGGTTSTPADSSTAATATPQASPEPLDCEILAYPCSLAEVSVETAERSMDLGDEGWQKVDGGASTAEVGAWLAQQSGVAEVRWTDDTIRFRLDGGRPTWISTNATDDTAPAAVRAPARILTRKSTSSTTDPRASTGISQSVAMNLKTEKRAIVLSPFKWELGSADPGDRVAALMRQTKGYTNGVTYLENGTKTDSNVTVDTFAHLDGNALVYVTSLSAKMCEDGSDGPNGGLSPGPGNCWSVIGAQEFAGDMGAQTAPGVELIHFTGGEWTLGVNSDFFKAHYPTGIEDSILMFNVPDIYDARLRAYMSGGTSEFLGWDNLRPTGEGGEVTMKFLQRLAETGSTVDAVFQELKNELRAGDGELFSLRPESGGTLRLREVVQLRDRASGGQLNEIGEINVTTKLGDGQPDLVPYMVDVDGLTPEQAEQTTINLMIGNYEMDPLLASDGEQIDDKSWRVQGLAEIGDLTEGQMLDLRAYVQLPEGGLSKDTATVRVAGIKKPEIGRVWAGKITSVVDTLNAGVKITRVADVEFTRDPNYQEGDGLAYFYVSGGQMTWAIAGSDSECSYSGASSAVPLDATEFNFLVFELGADGVTYRGWGDNDDGPSVDVQVMCKTRSYTYGSGAEGLWWGMPTSEFQALESDTMTGEYGDGAAIGTTWTWELHRVE